MGHVIICSKSEMMLKIRLRMAVLGKYWGYVASKVGFEMGRDLRGVPRLSGSRFLTCEIEEVESNNSEGPF